VTAARAAAFIILTGLVLAGCGERFDEGYVDRFDTATDAIRAEDRRAVLPSDFVGLTAEQVFAAAPADRAAPLSAQKAMGVGLLRQTFDWAAIERRRGRYTFRVHDRYVLDAAAQGIRIMPILFNPPRFHARRTRGRGTPPPSDPRSMARFAAALVGRYGPRGSLWRRRPEARRLPIASWQIWNEPNVPVYWPTGPDAGEYATLLRVVGSAIERSDPRAEIVAAGLPNSRLGVPLARYVRELYAAGAGASIDTFALHPYAETPAGLLAAVQRTRRLLESVGAGDTPIWVTELGWASGGPESPFTVGSRRQARYVDRVVDRLVTTRRRDRIRGFVYFNWRDAKPFMNGRDFWGLHTGLLDIRGRRKPAFASFRAALLRARAGR